MPEHAELYDPTDGEEQFENFGDEGEFEDEGAEEGWRDPEVEAELAELRADIESLNEARARMENPHEWATQHIDAQIDTLEEQTGEPLDEETANMLGRLAYQLPDENGVPSLANALAEVQSQQDQTHEAAFDESAAQHQERLGRPITQPEIDRLWEWSNDHDNPNVAEAWKELYPDGRDPYEKKPDDLIDQRLKDLEEADRPEPEAVKPLAPNAKPDETADYINQRLEGAPVEEPQAEQNADSEPSAAEQIDQKLGEQE